MPLYRFVDGPVASPTVLLDLDDQSPLIVEAPSMSPSRRRVSSFGSSARDGDVLAQKSYPDRTIVIPLKFVQKSTAEQQSEAIQKLARLLDGGAWLQWQSDGKIEPVFYRTKYGDIDIDDEIGTEDPLRSLTLNITAEPSGYGEAVTDTISINNDPTAGTNPMSFLFPDIQGDVATPLRLKVNTSVFLERMCIATLAHPSTLPAPPVFLDVNYPWPSPGTGWTDSVDTNAVYIGGAAAKVVAAASSGEVEAQVTQNEIFDVPIGNYRVFARSAIPVGWVLKTGEGPEGNFSPNGRHVSTDAALAWRDLGVLPVPFPGAPDSIWPDTDAPTANVYLSALVDRPAALPAGTVIIDAWVLVPAGLINSVRSSVALVALNGVSIESEWELWLDGLTPDASVKSSLNGVRYPEGSVVTTAFCSVTPGVENVLTMMGLDAVKGIAFDVIFTYYPRYLYDRPASS